MLRFRTANSCVLVLLLLIVWPPSTALAEEEVFADFEDGNWKGWTIRGKCFGRRPATGKIGGQNHVWGWYGKAFVNTFNPDDRRTGVALSRIFEIEKSYIRFLIGGGNHPERCCLDLLVNDKVVRSSTGRNSEELINAFWNVEEFIGKEARLRIVDNEKGAWGHILVDRITFDWHPRFLGAVCSRKLWPKLGSRRVITILWDPKREGHPAPDREVIEKVLFGREKSVARWFHENSCGRFKLENAGVFGWYPAKKPGEHYWQSDPGDKDRDGWVIGHVEKWAEAIRFADRKFDFAKYDENGDKEISPGELGILIVIPQNGPFGTNRPLAGREHPKVEPLVCDGVRLPTMAEWYTGRPANLGIAAHELAHLLLGAPDMYQAGKPWRFQAGVYSLMDSGYPGAHLDPFLKLKLGWLDPWPIATTEKVTLEAIETTGKALILYDGRRGVGEYFVVENRWRGTSMDAGAGPHGGGLQVDGIAVWHIVEAPRLFSEIEIPIGGRGEWGRRGIRLIRADGGPPHRDDRKALFSKKGQTIADDTKPANLHWLDGSPSGFRLTLLSDAKPEVRLEVSVSRPKEESEK